MVLYFYPKDMTSGCTIEAHNFQNDLAQFEATNAVILGVSVDTVDSHKQFCTKDGLTFHLLADPEHKVVERLRLAGRILATLTIANRNTFLIDPEGKIAKVWTKVDPAHVGGCVGGDSEAESSAQSRSAINHRQPIPGRIECAMENPMPTQLAPRFATN